MKFSQALTVVLLSGLVFGACFTAEASKPTNKVDKHTTVVFDTDVGTDDAVAMLVAAKLPGIKFDYIVATKGNASLEGATRNAILLQKYIGLKGKIVQGRMTEQDANVDEEEGSTFHGSDGMANISAKMIEELKLSKKDFQKYISYDKYSKKLARAKKITYVAVGPSTNLANALGDPKLASKIDKIYIMGGGIKEFNCSHNTEFNFSKDPKSIKKILESGKDITLFTLDLTNHQRVSDEQINALEAYGSYSNYITMLRFNKKSNYEYENTPAAVIHDAMPVLYMVKPEKFVLKDMKISVDKYGATKEDSQGSFIHVAMGVKEDILNNTLKNIFYQG